MQSILIKDTTREQRIQIVNKALNVCGSECEFCNGCDNLGGGLTDTFYQPYIDGGNLRTQCQVSCELRSLRNYEEALHLRRRTTSLHVD